MRFMMIVKANEESEAGVLPTEEMLAEMGKYNEELVKAGILLAGDGLQPSSKGARVRFSSGGKTTVVDGPFAETKELIAGYWTIQVKSRDEAIEWARRIPFGEGGEIEVRQVQEMSDFPPDVQEAAAGFEEMQRQAGQDTKIFVNLPVKDLNRSVEFFTKLGYTFNPQFTDENATSMIVGEDIFVMLLVEGFFKTFTPKPVADAKSSTETLVALSVKSRDEVDRIVNTALAAGASRYNDPQDHGFMYQWGFEDLEGHIWEYFWMDPTAIQG